MQGFKRRQPSKPHIPAGERVYAVGDIHGEAALFARLLEHIQKDNARRGPARTTLIILGDVIDRGPDAAGLLLLLSHLPSLRIVVLKGNHEATLVDCYRGDEDAIGFWVAFGGRSTLAGLGIADSVIDAPDRMPLIDALRSCLSSDIVDWTDRLPAFWSMGDYFFVHAGVRPGAPLDCQDPDDFLWIRHPFLSSKRSHGKVIVHGHTIERGVPALGRNRIGLDTGGHEHGRLTALGLEADQQWILQAVSELPVDGSDTDTCREASLRANLGNDREAASDELALFERITSLLSDLTDLTNVAGMQVTPLLASGDGRSLVESAAARSPRSRNSWARIGLMAAPCLAGLLLLTLLRPPFEEESATTHSTPHASNISAISHTQAWRLASDGDVPPTVMMGTNARPIHPPSFDRHGLHRPSSPSIAHRAPALHKMPYSPAAASQLASNARLDGLALANALAEDRIVTRKLNANELAQEESRN